MKVLIVFATIEGQTGKIARFAEREVAAAGHAATLADAEAEAIPESLDGFDKIILAAPVHERRHPVSFEVFLEAHGDELGRADTLMLSVSLSAAFPERLEEAQDYLDELKLRTRFTPGREALVAGAVRTGSYDYFATQVVRHVVLRGRDIDPSEGDREFTDWDALGRRIAGFLGA